MRMIYCNVNPFDRYNRLYILDEQQQIQALGKTELSTLGKLIFAECIEQDISNVHLYGIMDYLEPVINDLQKQQINEYGKIKIQVEVN